MADRAELQDRLRELALGWCSVGLVYEVTRRLQGPGTPLPETALDRLIPYDPAGIWWYLAFFVYIPWAYLAADPARVPWLRRSMQLCAVVCGVVYVLWPTTVPTPALPPAGSGVDEGPGMTLLRLLQTVDTPQNCLPSLHAALTLLCGWALIDLRDAGHRLRSLAAVVIGLAIGVSIVQLRRHVSLDLGAGLVVGGLSGWVCRRRERLS